MTISYPLTLPSSPKVRVDIWSPVNIVSVARSPFTAQEQVHRHQGQLWQAEIELPVMLRAKAATWQAFLLKLKGRRGTFLMGDQGATSLRGAGGGTPVIDGAHSARAESIGVRGLPDASGVWLPGDYIQVGSGSTAHLHMVLNQVDGDGSPTGEAQVDIWPRLREDLSDGASITVTDTVGQWRLANNDTGWTADELGRYRIRLACIEALPV